jgi:hypothetical protein
MQWAWTTSITLAMFSASSGAYAQWDPESTLGNGAYASLAASGDTLHLVYVTSSGGDLRYRRSQVQGMSWEADVVLASNADIHPTDPIATVGMDVYILYYGEVQMGTATWGTTPVGNLHLLHSGDGGSTWDAPCQLTTSDDVFRASLAASGSRVDIAWSDLSIPTGGTIHYLGSSEKGRCGSFGSPLDLGGVSTGRPQVASWSSQVHIVWEASDNTARPACWTSAVCPDNYYARSISGGASFELPAQHITDYTMPANRMVIGRPEIAVIPSTGVVVFVFQDKSASDPTNQDLFVSTSASGGAAGGWSAPQRLTTDPGTDNHPTAVGIADHVYLAWTSDQDDPTMGDAAANAYFSSSPDGVSWLAPEKVSTGGGWFADVVTATSEYAHVVYSPFAGGAINYRRRSLLGTGGQDAGLDGGILALDSAVPDSTPPDVAGDAAVTNDAGTLDAEAVGGTDAGAVFDAAIVRAADAGSPSLDAADLDSSIKTADASLASGVDAASVGAASHGGCSCRASRDNRKGCPLILLALLALTLRRSRPHRQGSVPDVHGHCDWPLTRCTLSHSWRLSEESMCTQKVISLERATQQSLSTTGTPNATEWPWPSSIRLSVRTPPPRFARVAGSSSANHIVTPLGSNPWARTAPQRLYPWYRPPPCGPSLKGSASSTASAANAVVPVPISIEPVPPSNATSQVNGKLASW